MIRTIKPEEFISTEDETIVILDVRRSDDYRDSEETLSRAIWKDPSKVEEWITSISKDRAVIIYCVWGGGVSNSIVDRLQAEGINTRFIEGGIEGFKKAGGTVVQK